MLYEAFSIQFQWIFSIKNSLKPLELTFLTSIYHQVFKPIKKLTLSCFVSLSIPTFLLGCIEMFLVICIVLDTISMDFLSKNSLKPLELTFLICYYRHVFKPIKKLMLNCLIEYSDFFVGMYRDVSCYLHRSRYNFNDFFKQKFIETTRTDISKLLLSSGFKLIKS